MKKIAVWITAALLLLCLSTTAFALGDDFDFDSGGSDWGGSDYSSDYSSDYDSGYSGGSSRTYDHPWITLIAYLAVPCVVVVLVARSRRRPTTGGSVPSAPSSAAYKQKDPASLAALKQRDPYFSEAEVEAKVKEWVLQFETAWCAGDMTPHKNSICKPLFDTYQSQLAMMKQNGEMSRSEDLAVMECEVERWVSDGNWEYLNVWLKEKKRSYKVSAQNPSQVIKGNRQTVYHLTYRWQLARPAVFGAAGEAQCKACGARVDPTQVSFCPYCGSPVSVAANTEKPFTWQLNKVEKLAQTNLR